MYQALFFAFSLKKKRLIAGFALLAMESLLKNLKKHLTCSICVDIYNKPKTISCLHTFCLECLANHASASHRQGKFRCPEPVRRKSIYPKEITSTYCRAVFSTTVCWVCLPSDGVAREAALLVPSVGRRVLRCTIALTVDDLCAQTVSMHMKC